MVPYARNVAELEERFLREAMQRSIAYVASIHVFILLLDRAPPRIAPVMPDPEDAVARRRAEASREFRPPPRTPGAGTPSHP